MGKEKNLMERLPLDALSQIFCSIHKLRDVLSLSTCSRRLRKASMNWRVWESCYRVYFGSLKGPLQFGTAVFLSHATSFRATSKAMFATYADASYDLILCVGDQPPSHCFWASAADPEMGVVQPDRITFVKEASELAILDAVFENIHPLAPRAPSLVPSGCLLPFQPLLNLFLG